VSEPQNVLITGASSGIGAATAKYLGEHGLRVYGTSRKPRTAPPVGAIDSPDRGNGVLRWLELDVCEDASVERCVEAMRAHSGHVDSLVCNAGAGIFGSVEETRLESARSQFEVNYFGVLRLLRAVLPEMRERGAGRVVLVGSLAGRASIPFQSHYSSSKAAIDALAQSLRAEVGPCGVHVSLVEPGDIATSFNDATDWSAAEDSAYGERIRACEKTIVELLPKAPPPIVVARAVHDALTAKRPRFRYSVGADSTLLPLGRRLLPESWVLELVRRRYGV
jgi:NAD(P)-dependent dehydrogenase (short-subunit alcohol dehydrogenase family)